MILSCCCSIYLSFILQNSFSRSECLFNEVFFNAQAASLVFHGIYALVFEVKSTLFSFQNIFTVVNSIFNICSINLLVNNDSESASANELEEFDLGGYL